MRIAILIKNEDHVDESVMQAYAFSVKDNTIVSVGSELLTVRNLEYLLIWLLGKQVNVVYIDYDSENIKSTLQKVGIALKSLNEIRNNPLLKQFLI